MYSKIVVLKMEPDREQGGARTVVLGFFDSAGILQLEIPRVDGKLFPANIARGQAVVFNQQIAKLQLIRGELK